MDATRNISRLFMHPKVLGVDPRNWVAKALALFVPNICLTCDNFVGFQGGCCAQCWSKLRFVRKPLCPVMGSPFSVDMGDSFLSAEAIADPPPFERLRSVVLYDEMALKLVSSIKYADRTDLAPWVGDWMRVAGSELVAKADYVVPVPLHGRRLRSRRFNQSAELARRIAKISGTAFLPEGLVRRKATRQQVGLTETERERNVSGAFFMPEGMRAQLKDRRILLVDDVYTTGATAKAATRALKRGGVASVDVLVFAKVETHIN